MPDDYYYSGEGFDDSDNNTEYFGETQRIPENIVLDNGQVVNISFGTTSSDGVSANQLVAKKLVTALKDALNIASQNITITSLYLKATTNGDHAPLSNHRKGLAIDISRINGSYVINLGANQTVRVLQEALDMVNNRRENFGPFFKHKLGQPFIIGRHQDHIHFSVNGD